MIIELSGGIDESSLARYAMLDVDIISLGALTHSVKNLPVNLEIIPRTPGNFSSTLFYSRFSLSEVFILESMSPYT